MSNDIVNADEHEISDMQRCNIVSEGTNVSPGSYWSSGHWRSTYNLSDIEKLRIRIMFTVVCIYTCK